MAHIWIRRRLCAGVQQNIAAFGGDPKIVTIAEVEPVPGLISVRCAACWPSPLSKSLIAGAIGESARRDYRGAACRVLSQAEQAGAKFAAPS